MQRRYRSLLACAGVLFLAASCSTPASKSGEPPSTPASQSGEPSSMTHTSDTTLITTLDAVRAAVGKSVRIAGTAANAKISAAVIVDEMPIYCLDQPSWPDELDGARVTVRGTLEYTERFKATTSPDGAISQGTSGGVYVVRTCTVDGPR